MAFLDRLFPLVVRKRKIKEFINLHLGCMSAKEYSLKFTQLSKYAPTMVADSRDNMNEFAMGIADLAVYECKLDMFIPSIHISLLMVHVKKIEEQKLKRVGRESKKVRTEYGNSSMANFEVPDKPRFKRRCSN